MRPSWFVSRFASHSATQLPSAAAASSAIGAASPIGAVLGGGGGGAGGGAGRSGLGSAGRGFRLAVRAGVATTLARSGACAPRAGAHAANADPMTNAPSWYARDMRRLGVALSVALILSGCGSKSIVSLSASIQNADLAVAQVALGTTLSGSFVLSLALGNRASGSTQVSLESFSLLSSADKSTLIAPLKVTPQGATFPLTVGVGQTKNVTFQLDTSDTLQSSEKAALCAGPVLIVGTVTDTLGGGKSIDLSSSPVTISGC
jgi:hypothetical protein